MSERIVVHYCVAREGDRPHPYDYSVAVAVIDFDDEETGVGWVAERIYSEALRLARRGIGAVLVEREDPLGAVDDYARGTIAVALDDGHGTPEEKGAAARAVLDALARNGLIVRAHPDEAAVRFDALSKAALRYLDLVEESKTDGQEVAVFETVEAEIRRLAVAENVVTDTVRVGHHEYPTGPDPACYGCLGTGWLVGFGNPPKTNRCSCVDFCHAHETVCARDDAGVVIDEDD